MPLFRRGPPPSSLEALLDAAYQAFEAQDWDAAAVGLARVVDAGRAEAVPAERLAGWAFDLALMHKFRRDWPAALAAGLEAAALAPEGTQEPAWWNLGIAATALHDWPTARRAWARYGVDLPSGDGPIETDLGRTPVRIWTATGAEVVWCRRIDPARARIENVPGAGSGRRWGEIVLHDGVPNGERVVEGEIYPVFDEIELWAPSAVPVEAVNLRVSSGDDVEALLQLADDAGLAAESWETMTTLCAACSEGRLDQDAGHTHLHDESPPGRCRVGVAATSQQVDDLLRRWIAAAPQRRGAGIPETVA